MSKAINSYDQETIINFNKEEKIAYIFTYEKTWHQHMEKRLGIKPKMENGCGGKEYEVDKNLISMPRAPRKLSDSTKKKMAETLHRNRGLRSKSLIPASKSDTAKNNEGSSIPPHGRKLKNAIQRP